MSKGMLYEHDRLRSLSAKGGKNTSRVLRETNQRQTAEFIFAWQLLSPSKRFWDNIFLLISHLYSTVTASKAPIKCAINGDLPDERYFEWDRWRYPWHHWAESQRKIAPLSVFISPKEPYVQHGFGKRGEQTPASGISEQTGEWVLRWLQCSR